MADLKISQLTAATTPLAGTEVLPIVQSGQTTQVSVANLTAGRTVSAFKMKVGAGAASNTSSLMVNTPLGTAAGLQLFQDGIESWIIGMDASDEALKYKNSGSLKWSIGTAGDATLALGNVVMGTAAKGVNFTANTPAAGMTSQLLNWYEEGTWTPNQGAAVSVVGAYSSSGTYTRVGRTVTITAMQSGATSISTSPSGIIFSNLPFTVGGGVTRYSGTTALQFSGVAGAIAVGGTTNVYSCGTLSGGDTIVTTLTYEV